jgi:hypothetical protein
VKELFTYWELHGKTLGTKKIQHPHPAPAEKNLGTWMHAASPHCLQQKGLLPSTLWEKCGKALKKIV